MKFRSPFSAKSVTSPVVAAVVGAVVVSASWGGAAHADPGQDGVAKLNDLTKQAEQMIQTVQSAQLDLDRKLQLQSDADKRHADDLAALEAAKAQVAPRQEAVDKLAAAFYMGGRADGASALLTAASPQSFICAPSANPLRKPRPSKSPRRNRRPMRRLPPSLPRQFGPTSRRRNPRCRAR